MFARDADLLLSIARVAVVWFSLLYLFELVTASLGVHAGGRYLAFIPLALMLNEAAKRLLGTGDGGRL